MTQANATDIAPELTQVVQELVAQGEQLLGALEGEREALRAGDVDQIHAAVAQKQSCVVRLEGLEQERLQLCAAAGLPADPGASLAATGAGLASSWQAYLALLERCRDANLVNARVTQVRRRHVEQALSILRGDDQHATAVYGPAGKTESASSHELGQA